MIRASSEFRAATSSSIQANVASQSNVFRNSMGFRVGFLWLFILFSAMMAYSTARAGQVADTFSKFTTGSVIKVDHSAWDGLLKTYVKPTESRLNVVDYGRFKAEARNKLTAYLDQLQKTQVTKLNKREQYAFWV
ncbi:MAG: hypothetical protein ACR2OW_14415, partial [Methyloligellaceae bacterium]